MAGKVYEIAFKIAGQMSGGFSKSFASANKVVSKFGDTLNDLNAKAHKLDGIVKMRQELSESAKATTKAMWKVKGLTQKYDEQSAKVAALGRQKANAQRKVNALAKEISEAGVPTKELSQKYAEAEAKLKTLTTQTGKAKVEQRNLKNQLTTAKTEAEKAKTAFDKKKAALQGVESAAGTTGLKLKDLIARQKELADSAEKARAALEKQRIAQEKIAKATALQNKMKGWASSSALALGGMGATGAGFAAATVMPAMVMEDAMADVKKVTDFDPKGLKEVQRQLEQMSLRVPMAATGLAQIMASAAQSGVAKEELVAFTEQAAKMGVAFDISAEEAGTMMSKWRSGMKLTQAQTVSLADAVNALSNKNAATAAQVGDVLMRYGNLGKVVGLTEKQTAAMAATVVAAGAESEVAATGIKALMNQLSMGEGLRGKAPEYFKNAGLDPKQLQKNLQKDAPAAIIGALESIKKNVPEKKWNEYLSKMFGQEASRAVGPMMTNLDLLKKNFNMVADEAGYTGSMLKEFEERSKTASNSLQLAKNAATLVASRIGEALLPVVQQASKKFVEVGAKVAEWISKNQGLVLQILKIVGAVTGVVAAFHIFRIALFAVGAPLLSVYKAIKTLTIAINLYKAGAKLSTAATLGQKVALLAVRGAVLLAKAAWIGLKAVCKASWWVIQKTAMLAAKGMLLLWKGAVLLAKGAWIGFKAVCKASWWIAQKVAILACKGAMLLWKGVCAIATAVQWAWNAALTANPIGVVIMLIAGLVAGGIALWKNWDKVKAKCAELWQSIKKWFGKIGDWIGGIWAKIGGIWDKVTGFFGGGKKTVEVTQKVSGAQVPGLASGGIATKPTLAMIGEGRESEAVLPLSKLKGMLGGGGGGMSVNFAPVINVSGGTADAYAGVKRGLEEGAASLKRELEKLMMGERRLSYY